MKWKYYLYLALFMPVAVLPFWALYLLSDGLYLLFYKVLRYRLHVVRQNLSMAFPEKTEAERRAIEKEFYCQFCDNIVETVKLLCVSDKGITSRIEVINSEFVEEIAREERPIVLFLGHYGNWEWVPAGSGTYAIPELTIQIYKPPHDKAFDRIILKIRSRFNTVSVAQKRAFRTLLEMRRDYKTFLVGFVADHRPNGKVNHFMTFLHQPTTYSVGGEEIGERIQAGYLYFEVLKQSRGHYRMIFHKVEPLQDGEPYPYTRRYMQLLEKTIRTAPPYWLWSHRRWLF